MSAPAVSPATLAVLSPAAADAITRGDDPADVLTPADEALLDDDADDEGPHVEPDAHRADTTWRPTFQAPTDVPCEVLVEVDQPTITMTRRAGHHGHPGRWWADDDDLDLGDWHVLAWRPRG